MTRVISVISGKGGVGKTTTTANLGAALAARGKNVVIVDANLTTPNLSLHLGIPLYPITLHDVLKGKAYMSEATYIHPSGMKIIPASLSVNALKGLNAGKLQRAITELLGKYEIVLIDAAAGLGKEAVSAIEAADELLIVTNPDLPSVTDALKTIKLAEKSGVRILGVVVNRMKKERHELTETEIETMLDIPVISAVPEDSGISQSISAKKPIVHYSPKSRAAREFKRLAARLVREAYEEPHEKTFFEKFFGWMG